MKPQSVITQSLNQQKTSNEHYLYYEALMQSFETSQSKFQETVALMKANLEETISLNEMAILVSISRRQLERLFQKHLNCSPSRYYLKLRLTHAQQLLKNKLMPIPEVACACGFVSISHFSKCYREHFGVTPRNERVRVKILVSTPLSGSFTTLHQVKNESSFSRAQL